MLLTDRRRAFGRREDDGERDAWQGSLFAPDALAPPAKPPGPTPDPFASPPDLLDDPEELEPVHSHAVASRPILAGPTLDDVMSRVWEGLRAEVPTPCPVCHAEIEPSAHGRCDACGSTLS